MHACTHSIKLIYIHSGKQQFISEFRSQEIELFYIKSQTIEILFDFSFGYCVHKNIFHKKRNHKMTFFKKKLLFFLLISIIFCWTAIEHSWADEISFSLCKQIPFWKLQCTTRKRDMTSLQRFSVFSHHRFLFFILSFDQHSDNFL